MRSSRKQPANTDRAAHTVREDPHATADGSSQRLQTMHQAVGNKAMGDLAQNSATRDHLLGFIQHRLEVVAAVQQKERDEMGDVRDWFKKVAKGTEGHHLPDPTRWHETARLYREATIALSQGDLGKGSHLLDRAVEAERAAFKSLPKAVDANLQPEIATFGELPPAATTLDSTDTCPAIQHPPEVVDLATRILNIPDLMERAPPLPAPSPWWEGEELVTEEAKPDDT